MKNKYILTILAFLLSPAFAVAQGVQGNVVRNGDNVNVVAPATVGLVSNSKLTLSFDSNSSGRLPQVNPAPAATPIAVASSGTIDSTVSRQRVTTAGAVTGVILENGVIDGQFVIVQVDKDAAGSVTFAAEGTSNVCSGTGAVIAAGEGALFVFDSTDTCWTELGT